MPRNVRDAFAHDNVSGRAAPFREHIRRLCYGRRREKEGIIKNSFEMLCATKK